MRIFIAFCLLWMSLLGLATANEYEVVCYYGNWAGYPSAVGEFNPEDINATLCTHWLYAFVDISEDGNVIELDAYSDLSENGGKNNLARFIALKNTSEGSKFIISIGGNTYGAANYSIVAANETLRANFVDSAVTFVQKYRFDGIDVNWQYPNQGSGVQADVQNFGLLLKDLYERFCEEDLILTAAVGAAETSASLSYNIPEISKYLDIIILLTYDYHISKGGVAGHNAPLYPATRETTESARALNINSSVSYWLDQGAPAEKLVLGIEFYGRTFTLIDTADHEPGAPISGTGTAGEISQQKGALIYYEICKVVLNGSWNVEFDEEQRVPYAYLGNQWVSYDNYKSVKEKAEYVKALGLGGVMTWTIDMDYFSGTICGGTYPFLNTVNSVLCD